MTILTCVQMIMLLLPGVLPGGQADERERRELRSHLAGMSPEFTLDLESEPWRGVQRRGDFVQLLIAEAEAAPGEGESKESIGRGTITVLKAYGKKYPGTGIDDYLRRVAID